MKTGVIAFYNTENFFDIYDDPQKHENEYTPKGSRRWTPQRYRNKVGKISSVLSEIGKKETGEPPFIIGLAEIENKRVLKDLVHAEHLEELGYRYIHYESLDERGMDTALLYREGYITPVYSEPIRSVYTRQDGVSTDYTRDILYVQFELNQRIIHTFTVHLPSRRDLDVNRNYRNLILKQLREKVDSLFAEDPHAFIVVMGDFNGNPNDEDARSLLRTVGQMGKISDELFNPMLNMGGYGEGSLKHDGRWILFDQILFSHAFFLDEEPRINFHSAHIYNDRSVQEWNRRFKGSPFRTFAGTKYLGGYSDHFPVYAIINY